MRKRKKRKKKSRGRVKEKLLLETSVQIERLKRHPHPENYLPENGLAGKELGSSFFVLYEYRTGLLRSLIDFYFLAGLEANPADALSKWSDKYQPRDVKNVLLTHSVMMRLSESIDHSDKRKYLRQLEAAITHAQASL
jgi:hypothetical protein